MTLSLTIMERDLGRITPFLQIFNLFDLGNYRSPPLIEFEFEPSRLDSSVRDTGL